MKMSDVFVSYSNEDKDRVEPLVRLLEDAGCSVWWDLHIGAGEEFDDVIERQIDAARCVIVVWTKRSIKSRWVKTEAAEGDRRRILVPVMLDDVSLPLEFRRIETANLVGWQGDRAHPEAKNLLESVANKLQQELVPAEVDEKPEPDEQPRSRKRLLIAFAAVILVAVAAYVFFWLYGAQPGGTRPPVERRVTTGADTTGAEPGTRSSGTACITPATTYDLDAGTWNPARDKADLFFHNLDGTVRSIDARSGAAFHRMGNRDFDSITYETIRNLAFRESSLDATVGGSPAVTPGAVFAVRTSDRRYAKVQVLQAGAFTKFKWLTYDANNAGPSVVATTSAPCTLEEQKRCGTGQFQGDSITGFTVPAASRTEVTVEVSYSYNRSHGTVYMGAHVLDEDDNALNSGYRPTAAPYTGKQRITINVDRSGRSKSLFIWLYEQNKREALVCRRFPFERTWGS